MRNQLLVLSCGVLAAMPVSGAEKVFEEKGGIVAIEAESTESRLGSWERKTDVADYSGECHLEFTGNKPESGPPKSPLEYSFKINKAGKYQLTIRARKRLESKRQDISNDCYVALKGNYSEGGGAPMDVLRKDTKMFGGNADGWGWTIQLDVSHKKFPAIYDLRAGETYELTISGRSQNFNIDRILLVHESHNLRSVQGDNPPESEATGGSGGGGDGGSFVSAAPTRRTLRNQDGKAIEAELLEKNGDSLSIRVGGRRYEIPISSLSQEDQEFLAEWEPGQE